MHTRRSRCAFEQLMWLFILLHLPVHVPGTHKQPAREILVAQPQKEPGWLQDAVRGGQSAALCA